LEPSENQDHPDNVVFGVDREEDEDGLFEDGQEENQRESYYEEGTEEDATKGHDLHEKRFFNEPLYCQRYQFVMDLLAQDRWKRHLRRLVDVGANDCSFLFRLRNSGGMRYMREVIALDVDQDELIYGGQRTVSLMSASLYRDQKRPFYPCDVYHMAGSIADKDVRLKAVDAVVAIEIIEHLSPTDLERFPQTVFGHMRPKVAVITTPNSDFNVLFGPSFEGPFRHWDHKFEFTRDQFQNWAKNIIRRYPDYDVEFDGVGFAPAGDGKDLASREHLGPCSQIAVFLRKDFEAASNNGDFAHREEASRLDPDINLVDTLDSEPSEGRPYQVLVHNHHPLQVDGRRMEERLMDSIMAEILRLHQAQLDEDFIYNDDERCECPKVYVKDLEDSIESRCYDDYGDSYQFTHTQIRDIMMKEGKGIGCGEDDDGIYFTVDEAHWSAGNDDQSEEEEDVEGQEEDDEEWEWNVRRELDGALEDEYDWN